MLLLTLVPKVTSFLPLCTPSVPLGSPVGTSFTIHSCLTWQKSAAWTMFQALAMRMGLWAVHCCWCSTSSSSWVLLIGTPTSNSLLSLSAPHSGGGALVRSCSSGRLNLKYHPTWNGRVLPMPRKWPMPRSELRSWRSRNSRSWHSSLQLTSCSMTASTPSPAWPVPLANLCFVSTPQ